MPVIMYGRFCFCLNHSVITFLLSFSFSQLDGMGIREVPGKIRVSSTCRFKRILVGICMVCVHFLIISAFYRCSSTFIHPSK